MTPNGRERLANNILARKAAAEVLAIASDEAARLPRDAEVAFWLHIYEDIRKDIEPTPALPKTIEPMNDAQAKAFDAKTIPFGKYAAYLVSTVAHLDPKYLVWLADAPNEFQQELKRYLRNESVSRDLEPNDE